MTERIYSTRAYERAMKAKVVDSDRDDGRVLLDRTVFYPGGGGQPHDTGSLIIGDDRIEVSRVTQDSRGVWHWVDVLPPLGTEVVGEIDWERRYTLMRTHTAMHAMCGVVWERFQSPVTGGNMAPGEGRLDFEIPQWDPEDRAPIESELNRQLGLARRVEVSFIDRAEADQDPSLIRTKVSLLPRSLTARAARPAGRRRHARRLHRRGRAHSHHEDRVEGQGLPEDPIRARRVAALLPRWRWLER